jgi:lambda repressor-like predicted transcriptional regulator
MKPKRDSLGVFVTLAGRDFDPDECTRAIGLEPSAVWKQRHEHLQSRLDLDSINWSVGFDEKACDTLSDAVDEVLDRVWPHREAMVRHAAERGLRITVTCTVRIHAAAPEYSLSPRTIERLAELKAGFLMDIFDHRDVGAT